MAHLFLISLEFPDFFSLSRIPSPPLQAVLHLGDGAITRGWADLVSPTPACAPGRGPPPASSGYTSRDGDHRGHESLTRGPAGHGGCQKQPHRLARRPGRPSLRPGPPAPAPTSEDALSSGHSPPCGRGLRATLLPNGAVTPGSRAAWAPQPPSPGLASQGRLCPWVHPSAKE